MIFAKNLNIMRISKELTRDQFKENFGTDELCLSYLADQKWKDGFTCKKCSHNKSCNAKKVFSKRCTKCGYVESPTAHTMFHKLKFGLSKAFEMIYDIVTSKKGASSIWLAERHGVKQQTAWLFRSKIQHTMKSSGKHPLTGEVQVDEFEIGTPKTGEQGRSKSENKVRVVIAMEIRGNKSGRAYARVIEDFSSKSLKPIFEDHISTNAKILTDKWTGYKPLKKLFPNFTQILSNKGKNFPLLHIQIRNFKNWLRGTHSFCSKSAMNQYINEYFYRFNRLNFRETMVEKLLTRMINHSPTPYKSIKCNVA